jgi:integrase
MKKEGLTAKQVEHAKPREKRYEMPAWPPKGLYLVVHPTGKKGWALRYRWAGSTRNLTFEKGYPDMPLAAARAEAERKLSELEEGKDPAVIQAVEIQQSESNSAKAIAELWLKRTMMTQAGTKKSSYGEVERILNRDILTAWKHKLITDITKADINLLLDQTVDRGAPILANRMLTIIKRWFKWAAKRDYIPFSPAALVDAPTDEESRDRVLTEAEMIEIWNAAAGLDFPFREYFHLLILTGQRRGEVANMEWKHVDLDKGLWTLPRTSTKSKRTHDVPLSAAALEILNKAPEFKGPYVFTSTSGERPISGFSKAKTAIDAAILERRKQTDPKAEELDEWHIHDLRRTMATWLSDNGIPSEVCGAILNHAPAANMKNAVTAVYARSKFAKEKRAALDAWGQYITALIAEKPAVMKAASA